IETATWLLPSCSSDIATSRRYCTGRLSMQKKPASSRTLMASDLPEPEMPVTMISCTRSSFHLRLPDAGFADRLLLAANELAGGVDAAQREHRGPHRSLGEHGEVAAGGHRDRHLAYRHAENVLRQLLQRQPLVLVFHGASSHQVHD